MTIVGQAINLLHLLQAAMDTRALPKRSHLVTDRWCKRWREQIRMELDGGTEDTKTVVFLYEYNACLAPAFPAHKACRSSRYPSM